MKKIVSVKEIMIILVSLLLIIISTEVSGVQTNLVFGEGNNNTPQTVSPDNYADAQRPEVENTNNNTTNTANNTKVYNNTNNTTDLPQTGIEDYNVGILLIICITSAIFAYRKINDYKNI